MGFLKLVRVLSGLCVLASDIKLALDRIARARSDGIDSFKFVVVMRAETTGYVTAPDVKSFSMCDGPKMVSIIVMCTD